MDADSDNDDDNNDDDDNDDDANAACCVRVPPGMFSYVTCIVIAMTAVVGKSSCHSKPSV